MMSRAKCFQGEDPGDLSSLGAISTQGAVELLLSQLPRNIQSRK